MAVMGARARRASADGRNARALVETRSGGRCEASVARVCTGRAGNFHHRQPSGMGGTTRPDTASLLLHVCGSGTTGCHGWIESHRTLALAFGWLIPRGNPNPSAVAVMWRGRRKVLLDDGGGMEPVRPAARSDREH